MLGVRRATVNVSTGMLKKAGFIRYVRGKLTVVDRAGLESAACNATEPSSRYTIPCFPVCQNGCFDFRSPAAARK
jgi:hypothetical protein